MFQQPAQRNKTQGKSLSKALTTDQVH